MASVPSFARVVCAALIATLPGLANAVDLRSPDGSISLSGDLARIEPDAFVVRTSVGELRVNRALVDCFGAECPKAGPAKADLVVRGSDTIGEKLMPMLINGYATQLGAAIGGVDVTAADTVALTVNDKFGGGAPILTASVQAAGSSTGLRALISRKTEIAMSSRPAKPTEVLAITEQGRGDLTTLDQEYIIGVDSILVVANPLNPVSALTLQQLAGIYEGRITNWAELSGPNLPIQVISRPESSGTRGVFTQAILAPTGATMTPTARIIGSNEDIAKLVAETPGAIAYVGFAYQGDTKPLDLVSSCGLPMTASAFAAKAEEYPLQRRLRLYVGNERLSDHANGLLDFAISAAADPHVRDAGFIDLSVQATDPGINATHVLRSAQTEPVPAAFTLADQMVRDLSQAQRLSTTFRFLPASAQLDNKSLRDLDRMVAYLTEPQNIGRSVIIAGYADSLGPFDLNDRLAATRAETVRAALLSRPNAQKLDPSRVRSVSYGELAPVGCNDTEAGRKTNRRVELWIQ